MLPAVLGLAAGLSACGSTAASADATVNVVEGYMKAVQDGAIDGGQTFLEAKSDEAVTGSTSASRYMAAHKSAPWKVSTVSFPPLGSTSAAPTKTACLVGAGGPGDSQICIVTVEVDAPGAQPVWFHFDCELRYGPWQIINVDRVDTKPDDLLPSGNEATKS
jgi:hypothetical protein